jgi:thioredoxin-related protein
MIIKKIIFILILINTSLFPIEIIMKNDTNKLTLIYFEMSHCPYCRKMRKESIEDLKLSKFIKNNFVYKNINIETNDTVFYKNERYSAHKFAKKINVYFYPTVLFLDKHNQIVNHIKGFRKHQKLSLILKYMTSNSYKTMSLETFIDEEIMK